MNFLYVKVIYIAVFEISVVFYPVKVVYFCVFMTFSTFYCFSDVLMDPWNLRMCVCVYICMYVLVLI